MEGKELNKELICKTLGQGDDKKKYYVYMLCDAKNKPFYIGKGEGGRIWQHEEDAHKKEEEIKNKIDEEVNKLEEKLDKNLTKPQKEQQKKFFRERLGKELKGNNDKIKKINSLGKDVTKVIVKWGLTNDEAYMVESALINMYKFIGGKNSLTNIANGHMSKKEKENRYCKTEVQTLQSFATNCVEPEKSLTDILKAYFGKSYTKKTAKDGCGILFVKINNFYPMCEAIENAADKDAAIRDAASGFWNVAENRIKNIEYVFALYQSQIVGIYYVKNATWVRKRKLGTIKIAGNSAKSDEGNLPFVLDRIRGDEYKLVNIIDGNWDNYDGIKGTLLEDNQTTLKDKLKDVLGPDRKDYAKALTDMGNKYVFIPKPENEIPQDNAFWKIRDAFLHKYINIPATQNSIYYNFKANGKFKKKN